MNGWTDPTSRGGARRGLGPRGRGECAEFLDSIIYLLDDELDEADVRIVQAHLEACSPCLERYDVQRTVKALVARSCVESAPDGLRQRVLLSIHQVQVQVTVTDPARFVDPRTPG